MADFGVLWWHNDSEGVNPKIGVIRSCWPKHLTVIGSSDFYGQNTATPGSHNQPYVNPFVRGRRPPARLRKSSIVKAPGLITRIVVNPAPVASEFDWIPSPYSDGFR